LWKVGFATVPRRGRLRPRLALLSIWRARMFRPRRMLPRTCAQADRTAARIGPAWGTALGWDALPATMPTGTGPAW